MQFSFVINQQTAIYQCAAIFDNSFIANTQLLQDPTKAYFQF